MYVPSDTFLRNQSQDKINIRYKPTSEMSASNTGTDGKGLKIFITGATGYIGGRITELAAPDGYTIRGLSRNEAGDAKVKSRGATPVRGDLTTLDVLKHEASQADIVLHLAFTHDFNVPYAQVLALDAAAVDALAQGIKGTNKPLLISSGSALVEPNADGGETDETAPWSKDAILPRLKAEQHALNWVKEGVNVMSIRLAPYVYGRGGHGFLAFLMQSALKNGEVLYIDDGSVHSSDCYIDAAAKMYILAARKGKPGDIFNCTTSTNITYKQLSEAIGEAMKLPVKSVSKEQAEEKLGPLLTKVVAFENRASSRKAEELLGWKPEGPDRLTELREGSYLSVAEQLRATGEMPSDVELPQKE
ncbi:MAG: hypothetical protein M1820_007336 [Bogoriella megaspora]|nr:MAG: hypothetical protein M1820_007336 [Bogoriella megaspora]